MSGVLFDLDGTLVDTSIDMVLALQSLAKENGIEIEADFVKYRELITYGSRALVTSIFGEIDKNELSRLQKRYLEIYENCLTQNTNLFNGMKEVIQYLDSNQISWGIVTNKPVFLAQPLVENMPELQNCKVLVGGGMTEYAKPHPQPILLAIEKSQIKPEYSWYIGDALTDIQAGRSAGMKSAGALWGYIAETDNPNLWQADKLLNHPTEILNFFK